MGEEDVGQKIHDIRNGQLIRANDNENKVDPDNNK